jgi:hypothetical protein
MRASSHDRMTTHVSTATLATLAWVTRSRVCNMEARYAIWNNVGMGHKVAGMQYASTEESHSIFTFHHSPTLRPHCASEARHACWVYLLPTGADADKPLKSRAQVARAYPSVSIHIVHFEEH